MYIDYYRIGVGVVDTDQQPGGGYRESDTLY